MKTNPRPGRCLAARLAAAWLCVVMLAGLIQAPALAGAADDPGRLVDLYCSQSAKDALGEDQLEALVGLIVTSIEPQAVNLLIERFPCFADAAANDELGREIGLYIYFETGDQDGLPEHEDVAGGAYAYVNGYPTYEEGKSTFKYMICIDAESLCTENDMGQAVLDMNAETRVQVDTTFCHELFHAFMDDYNRVGMSGYTDLAALLSDEDGRLTDEQADALVEETYFPYWFMEGLAGCVGNIYPADIKYFQEYRRDIDTRQLLDACTGEQLCRMYAWLDSMEDYPVQRFDLEASNEDNTDGHVNGAMYVSGYMACLYLADLQYRAREGAGALTFDPSGEVTSISSEKLREGLSAILERLHRGETLDEVIRDISGGAYADANDFTRRFIKGNYNEETQDYDGDPESLAFCVGFINYMNRLDALDPDTHPAGSVLMDDFGTTRPTPLEEDAVATSEFYRFVEANTLVASTVPNDHTLDGGKSFSGRDSFDSILERFMAR